MPSRPSSPTSHSSTPAPETHDPLLRTLEKAYHTRNGPLFVRTVDSISSLFKSLKSEMMNNAKAFFETKPETPAEASLVDGKPPNSKPAAIATGGVPVKLWKTIMEEVYQRSVGPDVDDTKKYKSFSSETYGELNPM